MEEGVREDGEREPEFVVVVVVIVVVAACGF